MTTNTSPRIHHLRPMLAIRGERQHMAHPVTLDGKTWTWVSLCGVEVDPARTGRALRRHRGHTRRGDCATCARMIRRTRMWPTPLAILAEALRR